jgi:hypothetical protein
MPFTDAVRLALSVPSQCQGTPAANASLLTWEINSCDQHSRDLEDRRPSKGPADCCMPLPRPLLRRHRFKKFLSPARRSQGRHTEPSAPHNSRAR